MTKNAFDGVLFKLHGMGFAVDALKVREVVGGAAWQSSEDPEERGIIETRGRNIPVVDLRKIFGFPSLEKTRMNSFIAVQVPGHDKDRLAALWVDSLLDMVHVPAEELKPPTDSIESVPVKYVHAVFEKDGENIYIIQMDAIVLKEVSEDEGLEKAAS